MFRRRDDRPLPSIGLILLIFLFLAIAIAPSPLLSVFLFLLLVGLSLTPYLAFVYPGYLHQAKQRAWQKFATSTGLSFAPGHFFKTASVFGSYRGCTLNLYLFLKPDTFVNTASLFKGIDRPDYSPYTGVDLSMSDAKVEKVPDRIPSVEQVINLFEEARRDDFLSEGQIIAKKGHAGLYYEQRGIETDERRLEAIVRTLCQLANIYVHLWRLGGELIPVLQRALVLGPERLDQIIIQLLYHIQQRTNQDLGHQAHKLLCPDCLARFTTHQAQLTPELKISYCGCRLCGQSRKYWRGQVIAVLDREQSSDQIPPANDIVHINWLMRRTLFDFDEVEILAATDEEVERFAVQVGNDTDPTRKMRYQQMRCTVGPDCRLSENSVRILKRTFGNCSFANDEATSSVSAGAG